MRSPEAVTALLIAGMLLAMGADLLPSYVPDGDGPKRLSEMLLEASVTATVKGRELGLQLTGPALAHRRLPAWNWVGLRRFTMPRPKKAVWPFLEAHKPGRIVECCLWVHPVNNGHLRLDFPAVGRGGSVHGFFHALRSTNPRMKVIIDVLLDGERLAELSPKLKPGGIWEFETELPGEGSATLSLVVKQKSRGKNHICIDGVVDD